MKRIILIILAFLAVAYPLILLFRLSVDIGYYDDWYDNLWYIGYFGEYFRRHFSFPVFYNTINSVGISLPIFYSYTLYPVLGVVSSLTGANLAVRLGLFTLYLCQFLSVYFLIIKIQKNKTIGFLVACIVIWAIYPLTNIYNRGSLPEVFSNGFLTIATVLWFDLLLEADRYKKIWVSIFFIFTLVMSLGSWSPGFIQGSLVSVFILLVTVCLFKKRVWKKKNTLVIMIVALLCAGVVLFPWLFVTVKFINNIPITEHGLTYYKYLDNLLVRFSPFPVDLRAIYNGLNIPEGAPYLDAQLNVPLFLLFLVQVFLLIKNFRRLAVTKYQIFSIILSVLLFIHFLLLSLSPSYALKYPRLISHTSVQYRFISYCNYALLIGAISAFYIFGTKLKRKDNKILLFSLVIFVTLSAQSVVIKNLHGNSITSLFKYPDAEQAFGLTADKRDTLLVLPGTAGQVFDYRDLKKYKISTEAAKIETNSQIKIPVAEGQEFGILTEEVQAEIPKDSWITVNMYPFPWNILRVDGKTVGDLYLSSNNAIAVTLNVKAGKHTFQVSTEPDKVWQQSRKWSFLVLFSTLSASIIMSLFMVISWLRPQWRYRSGSRRISRKRLPAVHKGRLIR